MAFRILTKDLLDLYAAMNQAVMNVLSRIDLHLVKQLSLTLLQAAILSCLELTPSVQSHCTRPLQSRLIKSCSFSASLDPTSLSLIHI